MAGRCGDCLHWGHSEPKGDVLFRICRAIVHERDAAADNPARVATEEQDGWNVCDATLVTRADFGCILHRPVGEPKEAS